MEGRRVKSLKAVWDGEPGDYYPMVEEDGAVTGLWFKLPTGTLGRIAATGYGLPRGGETEPEWDITVEADDTVTVEPSIQQHEVPGVAEPWHGHLRSGVWTEG